MLHSSYTKNRRLCTQGFLRALRRNMLVERLRERKARRSSRPSSKGNSEGGEQEKENAALVLPPRP